MPKLRLKTDDNDSAEIQMLLTRRRFLTGALATVAPFFACSPAREIMRDPGLQADAAHLLREATSIDLHCHANALGDRHFPEIDPAITADMKLGGLDAGIFAVRGDYPLIRRNANRERYEARVPRPGELFTRTSEQLDGILTATRSSSLALAQSPQDITQAKKNHTPAVLLALEGADPLEGNLARIKHFHDKGGRVVQLMHYRINEIGDIQTAEPHHGGLTPFGHAVVDELNRFGMVIDGAHCSSATLSQVLKHSRHPIIVSHTGPFVSRQFSRRLGDDDIKVIAKHGGLIGIWPQAGRTTTFETFLRRIDYAKKLVGADHVAIGTDMHGLTGRTVMPTFKEFALIPAGLLKRSYSETDTAKIIGGNFLKLFNDLTLTK